MLVLRRKPGAFSALAYDLWRHHDADIFAVAGDPAPKLAEMCDRFDLRIQLQSDPGLEVARAYTGVEESPTHGDIPIAGTVIVDPDGVVRYAQVADDPADRTYANYVRHFIKNGYGDPYP